MAAIAPARLPATAAMPVTKAIAMRIFIGRAQLEPALSEPANCRAQRGLRCESYVQREGGFPHGLAGCAAEVKVPHLGNVAIADTMPVAFSRAEAAFYANSMTRLSYLRRWPKDGANPGGVTIPNPHRAPRSRRPPPEPI